VTLINAHLAASSILESIRRIDGPARLERKSRSNCTRPTHAPAAPFYVALSAQLLRANSSAENNNEAPRNNRGKKAVRFRFDHWAKP
jgi:hypothetical protein